MPPVDILANAGINLFHLIIIIIIIIIPMAQQPIVGQGLLIIEASR
jgi:hypothetical protein